MLSRTSTSGPPWVRRTTASVCTSGHELAPAGRAVGREDGVRQAERQEDDRPVDRVHVVDVDLARVLALGGAAGAGIERGVDVFVDEGQDVRLLDGHDVVEIEGLVAVGRAK